jgi:ribosomal protein L11 methyltransferase
MPCYELEIDGFDGCEELISLFVMETDALGSWSSTLDKSPEPAHIEQQLLAEPVFVAIVLDGIIDQVERHFRSVLETFNRAHEAGLSLSSCRESVPRDWANTWREGFPVRPMGRRLLICPPWDLRSEPGRHCLVIEPGQAFGTGLHETTRQCLECLEDLVHPGDEVLDVGCGSGILALAAAVLGAGRVVGLDNDPVATEEAARNARLSGLEDRIEWRRADGGRVEAGRFDLIVANMLWAELQTCLPAQVPSLAPGGRLIVSGLAARDEAPAERLLAALGLVRRRTVTGELFQTWVVEANGNAGVKTRLENFFI